MKRIEQINSNLTSFQLISKFQVERSKYHEK